MSKKPKGKKKSQIKKKLRRMKEHALEHKTPKKGKVK